MKATIIMGSISDKEIAKKSAQALHRFGIEYETRVLSAHRSIDELIPYVQSFEANGIDVVIAIAGKAAHLAGVIAGLTILPVIAVPVKTSVMGGMDSLLSIVQMPSGVPVATVAIDGGENAGILAAQIFSLKDSAIKKRLHEYKQELKQAVLAMQQELDSNENKL
ncbi:5-(carboxyamino)imidazole ribonucleotide mutase [Treponema phagedenis]|uniref:N5-carboxyaminoimidazole ribonucleotide mutase n=1 Tax=Treponema phagedenis TaxID=162 RepID=A0A0B7GTV9_TREPH|nr:5-(carboxyamino)imidazole ribonucleotide mutase [Treponema phagedenis]NVP24284.1 5-(carboxyamino)imidazole ribonucleotide mutase [Treponema phagedenis]QEJ94254.1 5-(carboxyamino)imidazole ribonucleotide mutase [Treponema phagedenis]QEJ99120.1 5-(carboxyamino)imidazole ribonucleotide mutase [Treponema phagedenis]QEK00212.1 5-(carboxyamino)imidazole ribonucleotide mutase [Treponema phagedenis]QEK04648.1 5-(carboxyamino)imidazole ribonucleotide mutase [Treponema phagedenis]